MKRCALKSHENPTWGFVHSAPGLDWRHVGLPPAEYRFWLSQLPANGATLVHSLTGIPDTIPDKRILDIVARSNERAAKVYPDMDLAVEYADVAILWNEDSHPKAWMDVFAGLGLPFILIDKDELSLESLQRIRLAVLPEGILLDGHRMDLLEKFVSGGASLLYEGSFPDSAPRLSALCGIQPGSVRSPFLKASYLRFEEPGSFLRKDGLENTAIIALNGEASYCHPSSASVLATLVPPYVPDAAAGTPPERASIRTEQTGIPMVLQNLYGAGKAACLPFSLSTLISRYGMSDHLLVMKNLIAGLVGTPLVESTWTQGLNMTLYKGPGFLLIHLLNCAGTRPLVHTLPLHGIEVSVRMPEEIGRASCRERV